MRAAVIGGGITGLVAARRLAAEGAEITVFEASGRWGGQLRTVDVNGRCVDVGAEALHRAAPQAVGLLEELGLMGETVAAAQAPSWLFTNGRLRPLPAGFSPAGPSRLWPLVTSRILSPGGTLRAALEPLVRRGATDGDEAVGVYLSRRFGTQVVDRLVDPLLGGLHAGDVWQLGLEAATPQLAQMARRSRSLVLQRRPQRRPRRRTDGGPGFVTLDGGMRRLVDRLVADLGEHALRPGTPVRSIAADGPRYRLSTDAGDAVFHAIVLAVPAGVAAGLLADIAPQATSSLSRQRVASIAIAVHTYPADVVQQAPALAGTGLLVASGEGRLLKAATFLTTKWPHLAGGDDFLVRLSAGRVDDHRIDAYSDDELTRRLHDDLREMTGLLSPPERTAVFRWPGGMPQLEVGHARMLSTLREQLAARHPHVALAGAAYDGVGVAACIASAQRAADQLLTPISELTANR